MDTEETSSRFMRSFATNLLDISPQDCTKEIEEQEVCCNPVALAIGRHGEHVVVEANSRLLKLFTSKGNLLKVVTHETLLAPCDVTITNSGKIVVTDSEADDVKVFSRRGKLLLTSEFGNHLLQPQGIDYNPTTGEIAICDQGANCVYLHDPSGRVRRILRRPRPVQDEDDPRKPVSRSLSFLPSHVKFHEQSESIVVSDTENQSIYTFNAKGECITEVCTSGEVKPSAICQDLEGNIYFVDASSRCVYQVDCAKGRLLEPVIGPKDGLAEPLALAMDLYGHIVVTENGTGLVKTFNLK